MNYLIPHLLAISNKMKAYFSYNKNKDEHGVLERDVLAVDIHTRKYVIRIRGNGILVIRNAHTKNGIRIEEEVKLDKNFTLT